MVAIGCGVGGSSCAYSRVSSSTHFGNLKYLRMNDPNLPAILSEVTATLALTEAGRWVIDRTKGVRTNAIEAEQQRVRNYLGRLTRRVSNLEHRTGSVEEMQQRIEASLEDPDFWAAYEDACEAAGRTGVDAKHEMLARAVTERLIAAPESMNALASTQAIGIIPRLTVGQLEFLGLAALVYALRPRLSEDGPEGAGIDGKSVQAALEKEYAEWLHQRLRHYISLEMPNEASLVHLVSMSCLSYDPGAERSRREAIARFGIGEAPWDLFARMMSFEMAMSTDPAGPWLEEIWRTGPLQRITLTTAGLLIGVAAHDAKTDSHSDIDLERSRFASEDEKYKPTGGARSR